MACLEYIDNDSLLISDSEIHNYEFAAKKIRIEAHYNLDDYLNILTLLDK